MYPMPSLASGASAGAPGFVMSMQPGSRFATRKLWPASSRLSSRRPGRTYGFAQSQTAICRRPGAMHGAENRAVTIRAGVKSAMRRSTSIWCRGKAPPIIRERVEHDLTLSGLPRPKILATIVRLMETTYIRVGNQEYARHNKSYGLTTMRGKHVEVHGSAITFTFPGKSGVHHAIHLEDRRLARIVRRCQDLPGYELFQYLDADRERHTVDSHETHRRQ